MNSTTIKSFYPTNNRVLLRPIVDTSKFTYRGMTLHTGLSLADGKPYDPLKAAPVVCEVVSAPRRLIYGTHKEYYESVEELDVPNHVRIALSAARKSAKFSETTLIEKPVPGSMMWKTKMDVLPGDVVWCNANAMNVAKSNGMTFTFDGVEHYLLDYSELYIKKRKDKVVCLNGWVLAELIEHTPHWTKRAEKMGLVIPSHMKKEEYIDRFGIVRYIGDPVEYLMAERFDEPDIKKGDVFMFKQRVNRRLEPGQKFFGGQDADYIVTRRCNIMAIMEN